VKVWYDYRHWLDQPLEVSLETQALCNARCTFCPYPSLERIGTKMPDELIDRLVAEMATWKTAFMFSPFKVNEPLLDKRTLPLCERMNRDVPKARLRLFTNGQPLTAEKVEQIGRLKNVEHLWISLNSHIPEDYERLMGLDFEKTAKRLDHLHSVDFPHKVMLSCVGFPNEDFRRYCFERWPEFESTALKKDAWIDFTDAQNTEIPDAPCARWWELSITSTGVCSTCCMDGEAKYPIGDVNTQTMLEVYNSPFWRERREGYFSRKQLDSRSPCAGCTY
jgi:hypothetical protein